MKLREIILKVLFGLALLSVMLLALLPTEMLTLPVFKWWDKVQHALAFGVLALLGFAAFPNRLGRVVMGLVLYGVAIELAQLAVGWRFGEWQDVMADTVGVVLAWALGHRWLKPRQPPQEV